MLNLEKPQDRYKYVPDQTWQTLPSEHPEQIPMAGGKAASSKGPALHLIPTVALEKIAERFELGIARKGDKAWNALSKNQEVLDDVPFLIERCSHIIHHAMKLRDQLAWGVKPTDESMMANATAVGWGAIFLTCAAERISQKNDGVDMQALKDTLGISTQQPLTTAHTVFSGASFVCDNGMKTGCLVRLSKNPLQYAGTIPDVVWNPDGTPVALNKDLTEAELAGYKISL